MADTEKGFFIPHPEFQPLITYREVERSPLLIIRQTHALLGLYYRGAIRNPQPATDYLRDYTMEYLKVAEEGSATLYSREGKLNVQILDLEIREAAQHAFVVFAHLPDKARSPFLPQGFSRHSGTLSAPETRDQFLARIKELKNGILQIVIGKVEPYATLEAYPSLLRTFKFFEVGNELPVKLTDDERKQERLERERFNDLLGGIDISL